jgi:hypothetical protein
MNSSASPARLQLEARVKRAQVPRPRFATRPNSVRAERRAQFPRSRLPRRVRPGTPTQISAMPVCPAAIFSPARDSATPLRFLHAPSGGGFGLFRLHANAGGSRPGKTLEAWRLRTAVSTAQEYGGSRNAKCLILRRSPDRWVGGALTVRLRRTRRTSL